MNAQEAYESIVKTLKLGRKKYPHQHSGELWGGNGYACFVGALAAGLGENIEHNRTDDDREIERLYDVVDDYIRPFGLKVGVLYNANDRYLSGDGIRDEFVLETVKEYLGF